VSGLCVFKHSVSQFEQEVVTIHPGEYYATSEDTIISTVLGSCVAVGLFDETRSLGGLNHFMLPGEVAREDLVRSPNAKYGMYAMELLINELLKLGAKKNDLRAKVFGGASILRFSGISAAHIPQSNIDFALSYLKAEGIPLAASDVGGQEPRKIFFYARSGKVLLKRIPPTLETLVEKEEERYLSSLKQERLEGIIKLF
jgi:chemotaxis protein CheD